MARMRLRKTYRRRRALRGRPTAGKNRSLLLSMRRQLIQRRPEVKYYSIAIMTGPDGQGVYGAKLVYSQRNVKCNRQTIDNFCSLTGISPLFVNFSQGTRRDQRIGNHIFIKGVSMRLQINRYSDNTTIDSDNPITIRVMLLGVHSEDDPPATVNNFANMWSSVAPPACNVRFLNKTRQVVHYDRTFTMTPTVAKTGDNNLDSRIINIKKYIKINRKCTLADENFSTFNPKDDRYNFFLLAVAHAPGVPHTNSNRDAELQLAPVARVYGVCRIYFTDV